MKLHELKVKKGATKRRKKVGRGLGSGHGTYSTRGMKGQKSRSGSKRKPGFEGGRTPLISQIPKNRGFKSIYKKPIIINISDLENKFKDGDIIERETLIKKGLLSSKDKKVKILGNGKLKKKLIIKVSMISKNAEKIIIDAGGKIEKKQNENRMAKTKKA